MNLSATGGQKEGMITATEGCFVKLSWVSLLAIMAVVSSSPVSAETYSWTDDQGTVHFTEDPGKVPAKYRGKPPAQEEAEPPLPQADPAGKATNGGQLIAPGAGEVPANGLYAGKSYDQWQQELVAQETAMTAVRDQINELVMQLRSYGSDWYVQEKLVKEYKGLLEKFKGMKADYNQLVESARKAGLEVNLQQ
jgi:hypothetical protein